MCGEGCVICDCRQHKYTIVVLTGGAAMFQDAEDLFVFPVGSCSFKPTGYRTVEQIVDVTVHMFGRSVDAVQFASQKRVSERITKVRVMVFQRWRCSGNFRTWSS